MTQKYYRDKTRKSKSKKSRGDEQIKIIQSHRKKDLSRKKLEETSKSEEFICLIFIIIIIIIIFVIDYILKGSNKFHQNEFVLSPRAHSFCVNEFINSVEILGNKIVSMEFLTSSKHIPMYYAYIRLLLKNSDTFKALEQNLLDNHGDFLKHYYTAHRSYTSIFFKSLKYFSNMEQNIQNILEYNNYKTTPIIIRLKEDSNLTSSKNIFVKFYQSLIF
ncbi:hypothetical protein C1645_805582, partial [Glomus cerebriforme]